MCRCRLSAPTPPHHLHVGDVSHPRRSDYLSLIPGRQPRRDNKRYRPSGLQAWDLSPRSTPARRTPARSTPAPQYTRTAVHPHRSTPAQLERIKLLDSGLLHRPAAASLMGRALNGIASVPARVQAARVRLAKLTRLLAYRPPAYRPLAIRPENRDRISHALAAAGAADRACTGRSHTRRPPRRVSLAGSARGVARRSGNDSWQYLRIPAPRDPGADA